MGFLTPDEMKDGTSGTMVGGDVRNLIPLRYEPFQTKKGKTMPKHILRDADTNEEIELVGYAFHDAIKKHNDAITPEVTVLHVEAIDNGTQYPEFNVEVAQGSVAPAKPADKTEIPF